MRYFIGLVVAPVLMLFLKLFWLLPNFSSPVFVDWAIELIQGDILLVSVLSLLAHFLIKIPLRSPRVAFALLLALINFAYLCDTFLVVNFNARLQLQGLGPLFADSNVIRTSVFNWNILLAVFYFICCWITLSKSPKLVSWLLIVMTIFTLLISLSSTSNPLNQKYVANALLMQLYGPSSKADVFRYSDLEILHFKQREAIHDRLADFRVRSPKDNILMVIVESLSAVDSFKTSGVNNRLKRLDALSERGMLFTNFFANYGNSEGGEIALISGKLPIRFPGADAGLYESFGRVSGVPNQLKSIGYVTEYLASTPDAFMARASYVSNVGFDSIADQVFFDREIKSPHFAFGSPSDEVLYTQVLSRVEKLQANPSPFFFSVITGSSHRPYMDPLGRDNTEENVWDYVDAQLEYLVSGLDKLNFFDKGILLIVGDHVKLQPLTASELLRYKSSADHRVVLVAIGKGVPRGVVDTRYFQQSDLLPKLYLAIESKLPLSPYVTYIFNHWIRPLTPQSMPVILTLIESEQGATQYEGQVVGRSVNWKSKSPEDSVALEQALNQERALNQDEFLGKEKICEARIDVGRLKTSSGVELNIYSSTSKARQFSGLSSAPLFSSILESFNVKDFRLLNKAVKRPFDAVLRGRFEVANTAEYWFRSMNGDVSCLYLDGKLLIEDDRESRFQAFPYEASAKVEAGEHFFELRLHYETGLPATNLLYSKGELEEWTWTQLVPGTKLN